MLEVSPLQLQQQMISQLSVNNFIYGIPEKSENLPVEFPRAEVTSSHKIFSYYNTKQQKYVWMSKYLRAASYTSFRLKKSSQNASLLLN